MRKYRHSKQQPPPVPAEIPVSTASIKKLPQLAAKLAADTDLFNRFGPGNEFQRKCMELFKEKSLMFFSAPAGAGKTMWAVRLAIQSLVEGTCSRIVLSRPQVDAGEQSGFLPGSHEEKMGPWLLPVRGVLNRMFGNAGGSLLQKFEVISVGFFQGITLDNCTAIIDEAQNATWEQLRLICERLGQNGKIILCGCPGQSFLPPHKRGGFERAVAGLKHLDCVGAVEFQPGDKLLRSPFTAAISSAFDKMDVERMKQLDKMETSYPVKTYRRRKS